ncbi:MAG: hypothetical protein IT453_13000, partial [Planctomycetes bacterium]|nr:hypothetical protein [Planctomycetota bacterium]
LEAGDAKRALDWLALEALSGRRETLPVAEVLAEYVDAEAEELAAGRVPTLAPLAPECERLPEPWLAAARAHDATLARPR